MIEFKDWIHLFNWQSIILATPGLISGAIFVIISKKCVNNDFALPASMMLIPGKAHTQKLKCYDFVSFLIKTQVLFSSITIFFKISLSSNLLMQHSDISYYYICQRLFSYSERHR